MRQRRFDQGRIRIVGDMSISNVMMVEAQFYDKGESQILAGLDMLFWPASRRVSSSEGGALYW